MWLLRRQWVKLRCNEHSLAFQTTAHCSGAWAWSQSFPGVEPQTYGKPYSLLSKTVSLANLDGSHLLNT